MYLLSPVFGHLADRRGASKALLFGLGALLGALGVLQATGQHATAGLAAVGLEPDLAFTIVTP